jgi:hypothetical protein
VNVFNIKRVRKFRRTPEQLVYGKWLGGAAARCSLVSRGIVVAPLRTVREAVAIERRWILERISLKRLRGLPF